MEKFTLRQARMLKGYSQERVASEMQISVATYAKYEANPERIPIYMARKLAYFLNRYIRDFEI